MSSNQSSEVAKSLKDPSQSEQTQAGQSQESADSVSPAFGWTPYAEKINGRFAMIGLVSLFLIEVFTQQDFFTWLNLW